jgi:putative transposase
MSTLEHSGNLVFNLDPPYLLTLPMHQHDWVLVMMDEFTRRLIGFAVHAGEVDGVTLCRVFNRVISGKKPLGYLSYDHDPLFEYHR